MKTYTILIMAVGLAAFSNVSIYAETEKKIPQIQSQWNGKKVAFLGDSITDKRHLGTSKNYWQFLEENLGIIPAVYGLNGHMFQGILGQSEKLKKEMGDTVDAIIIFAGTNDFNAGIPLGEWYSVKDTQVGVAGGKTEIRKRRTLDMNQNTFRGRINIALAYLKDNFSDKQIILLTPIHRGYATFGKNNVQPDESFPNRIGLYVDDYVNAVKEAANVWAVPVIDLNAVSGLFPARASHAHYFSNKDRDMLHPNANGHARMAKALVYQLLTYPVDLK